MDDPLDLKLLMTPSQPFSTDGIVIPSTVVPTSSKNVFKCDNCDASYTDKVYFDLHKQTHHQSKEFPIVQVIMNTSTPQAIQHPQQGTSQIILQEDQLSAYKRAYSTETQQQIYTLAPASQYQIVSPSTQNGTISLNHSLQQSFPGNTFVMTPGENNHHLENAPEVMEVNEGGNQELERNSSSNDYILPCTSAQTSSVVTDHRRRNLVHRNSRSRVVLSNTKERPFKCDQCTASFLDREELEEHKKKHTKDGPFTCEDCHFTFMYKSHFRSHKTRCMKKRSMMVCSPPKVISHQQLKYEFPTNGISNIGLEQMNHSPQSNFKYTTSKGHMMNKLHGSTLQKNHNFSRQNSSKLQYEKFNPSNPSFKRIKKEGRMDRPYECNECDASFQSECDLSNHKVKHTGDGPFTCEQCKFVFLYRKLYEAHKRRCEKKRRDSDIFPSKSSQLAQQPHKAPILLHQQNISSAQSAATLNQLTTSVTPNVIAGTVQLPGTTEQTGAIEVQSTSQGSQGQQQHVLPNSALEQVVLTSGSSLPSIIGGGRQDVKYEIVPIPAGLIDLSEGVINVNQIMNFIKLNKGSSNQ